MPRYVYYCKSCDDHFLISHSMKERQKLCQLCNNSGHLTRVPQMPVKIDKTIASSVTGEVTKEFIENNNKLLKEMKEEARKQVYDD